MTEIDVELAPARSFPRSVRALGYRDYLLFWSGGLVSNAGSHMQLAALLWVVATETHSAFRVTVVGFVGVAPLLPFSPLGGHLADRFSRRRVLMVMQSLMAGQAFALFALWRADLAPYWVLVVLSLLGGVLGAVNTPAWQSLPPQLVDRSDLQNAITLNSTQFNITRAIGPMLAGFTLAHFGAGVCFLVNAISFGAVILALLAISERAGVVHADAAAGSFRGALRYIGARRALVVAIAISGTFSFVAAPVVQLIPTFSVEVLHVGSEAYGVLLGALGVGAIAAALAIGAVDERVSPSWLLGVGLAVSATSLLALAVSTSVAAGVVTMVGYGAAYLTIAAMNNTTIQVHSDDRHRGRVTGAWLMTFGTCFPAGVLAQGALVDAIGARAVLIGDSVVMAVLLAIVAGGRLLSAIDR